MTLTPLDGIISRMAMQDWTQADVGCHWTRGEYTISTASGGGMPSGYVVYWRRQLIGDQRARFRTFGDAETAAQLHEATTDA